MPRYDMQAEIAALSQQVNRLKGRREVVKAVLQKMEADPLAYSEKTFVEKVVALEEEEFELRLALLKVQNRLDDLKPHTALFSIRAGGFTSYFGNTRMQLL